MKYIKQIINWLYKIGILEYPYLDLRCEFGGFKPDTKVHHKKYGDGEIMDYATYCKYDREYVNSVFFDSVFEEYKQFTREYGCGLPLEGLLKSIPCSELVLIGEVQHNPSGLERDIQDRIVESLMKAGA